MTYSFMTLLETQFADQANLWVPDIFCVPETCMIRSPLTSNQAKSPQSLRPSANMQTWTTSRQTLREIYALESVMEIN